MEFFSYYSGTCVREIKNGVFNTATILRLLFSFVISIVSGILLFMTIVCGGMAAAIVCGMLATVEGLLARNFV